MNIHVRVCIYIFIHTYVCMYVHYLGFEGRNWTGGGRLEDKSQTLD